MKRICISLFLLVILFNIFADGETRTYTIGVEDYESLLLPYSSYMDGVYEGLGKEVLDLFAEKKGYRFVYKVYPLKRRDSLFVTGELDFIFPDNPNWIPHMKEGLEIHYAPMVEYTDAVIVRRENLGRGIDSIKVLGIPLGFTPWPYNEQIEEGSIRLYDNASLQGLIDQVASGRIDGAYINMQAIDYLKANSDEPLPLEFDLDLPHSSGYYHLSSLEHREIVKEFALFMEEFRSIIVGIRRRYGFED